MPNTATVTGTIGPGDSLTSTTLENVSKVEFDFIAKIVRISYGTPTVTAHFSYSDIATVTFSISGEDTTVTIST